MFVAERTETCYVEHEKSSGGRLKIQPARGQHSQEMSARKNQYIAVDRPGTPDHTISAGANLLRRFSVGTTIAKQVPIRSLRMNLRCSQAFVIAVVPFHQIRIDLGYGSKARQFTSSNSAQPRTRKYLSEIESIQPFPETQGIAFATLG